MKIVSLCGKEPGPVVKIADDHVEIGEEDNICVLTESEWEALKEKILNKEIETELIRVLTTDNATEVARKRYDRIAVVYDFCEAISERFGYGKWRELLWSSALTLAYSKHLSPTCGACPLGSWPSVLHSYSLGILHFPFGTTFHTVCLHRSTSFLV